MSKRILVIDDDNVLCSFLHSYLLSAGFTVYSFNEPNSALNVLNSMTFDLIITDIIMPDIDGYELIKIIRSNPFLKYIPIIFLTAKGMTYDRIKAYNLGCSAYISKPFDPQELLSIINSIFLNLNTLLNYKNFLYNKSSLSVDLFIKRKLNFTPREKSILKLLMKGLMNKEIAVHLNLSVKNVDKYVGRLLLKTSSRNRTELAKMMWMRFYKGE